MVEQNKPKKFDQEDKFQILPKSLLASPGGRIVVLAKLCKVILVTFHSHELAAHQGIEKTVENMRGKHA
jgi:hypothetical protein